MNISLDEFCGLRSKWYSNICNDENIIKFKGIKKILLINKDTELLDLNKKDKNWLIKTHNLTKCFL